MFVEAVKLWTVMVFILAASAYCIVEFLPV